MTHQTNEALIKAFKNHLDYYKDLKDKWEFLKTPEDRAFHAGKTQGMLLGLEVIERISIPQPEQSKEIIKGDFEDSCPHCKKAIYVLPRRVKQIEVEIVQNQIVGARTILYKIVCVGNFNIDFLDKFYSKQEALDFCKRYNLKIVNEEKE
jgi:hypothetical protein